MENHISTLWLCAVHQITIILKLCVSLPLSSSILESTFPFPKILSKSHLTLILVCHAFTVFNFQLSSFKYKWGLHFLLLVNSHLNQEEIKYSNDKENSTDFKLSTWLVTGLIVPFLRTSSICSELKFDNPMDLTKPLATNFSISNQQSVGWRVSSYKTDPSSLLGNLSSPRWKAWGQWMR